VQEHLYLRRTFFWQVRRQHEEMARKK